MADVDYKILPLSFEKGLNEQVEDTLLPVGTVSVMQNWQASPTGEARARAPWYKGSATSAPATRKTSGIGYFSKANRPAIYQKTTFEQESSGAGTSAVVTLSWPTATKTGNCLVVVVGCADDKAGDVTFTFSETNYVEAYGGDELSWYYWENADSTSGSFTVTCTNMDNNMGLFAQAFELSGISKSGSLDTDMFEESTSASSTSMTASYSSTPSAQAQNVMLIAWVHESASTNYWVSGPTQSHDLLNDGTTPVVMTYADGNANVWISAKSTTGTSVSNPVMTVNDAATHRILGIVLKGWNSGAYSATTPATTKLLAAHDNTTSYTIYAIERENVSAGTWSSLGALTTSDSTELLAMAPGMGSVWITGASSGSLWEYDGQTLSSKSRTPAGRCVAVHKNRVWVSGSNAAPGRLQYSEINDGGNFPAENFIEIQRDSGEFIEDIVPFSGELIIGTRTSLWHLSGSGPDSFILEPYPSGGLAPGRTLMPTPYGVIAAGRSAVYLIADGVPQLISRPIQDSYGLTGTYMTTSYVDDYVYILDQGSGVIWSLNLNTGTWAEEIVSSGVEKPVQIYNHDNLQFYGPSAATVGSLLNYRSFPVSTKAKDFDTLTEAFTLTTPELCPVGPEFKFTPRHLFLRLRQHGGNETHTGLTVTPYYDGEEYPAKTIAPEASAGIFRVRLDLGEKKGIDYCQFKFSQSLGSTEDSVFDIEEITFGFNQEERR